MINSRHTFCRAVSLFGISSMIIVVTTGCGSDTDELKEARQQWVKGNAKVAAAAFTRYLDSHPDDHEVRLEFAKRLSRDDPTAAIEQLAKIPDDSDQCFEAAKKEFQLTSDLGIQQGIDNSLERLLRLRPDDPNVVLAAAENYYNTSRLKVAEEYARRAVRLQPARHQSWLLLAEILDDLGRTAEAIEPLETAKQLASNDFAVRANLAYAYQYSGRLDDAEAELNWCLKEQPNNASVLYIKALMLRAKGDNDQALEVAGAACAADPGHIRTRLLQADLLLFRREAQAAYDLLKPVYQEYKTERPFLGAFGRAAAMSGHRDEARKCQEIISRLISEATTREATDH